jgi:hypothetical protein
MELYYDYGRRTVDVDEFLIEDEFVNEILKFDFRNENLTEREIRLLRKMASHILWETENDILVDYAKENKEDLCQLQLNNRWEE